MGMVHSEVLGPTQSTSVPILKNICGAKVVNIPVGGFERTVSTPIGNNKENLTVLMILPCKIFCNVIYEIGSIVYRYNNADFWSNDLRGFCHSITFSPSYHLFLQRRFVIIR